MRLQRGFSLLELALSVFIISILMYVFAVKVADYQAMAADVAVQHVVGGIRTGLAVRMTELMARGDDAQLVALAQANPVALLAKPPVNYLGERPISEASQLSGDQWFFEPNDKCLIYLLNSRKNVATEGQKLLKFKVKLVRLSSGSGKQQGTPERYGVVFEQVDKPVRAPTK